MALSIESSSSSFTPKMKWKYHVFLSFRGVDTRHSFTERLYNKLKEKGLITFWDENGLQTGEDISQQLVEAIEESLCSVVILSENFASSTWCLEELKKILESKHKFGQQVVPVFYRMEVFVVRHQTGKFAEAFKDHEKRYKHDKVDNWRNALTHVANLSGFTSTAHRSETDLIENIAKEVCAMMLPKLPSRFDGLVGIDSKVKKMKSLLEMDSEEVYFVGIWGMGGIGKTTLATVVYEEIQSEFEISCILPNVRADSEQYGLVHLQRELLSSLKHRNLEPIIKTELQGREKIRHFLCHMKVLLVLDDVSDKKQLHNLAGNQEWFGPGSRIIITTRDKHLLTPQALFKNYDIQLLNADESLKLFCLKAFHKDQPEAVYLELSKGICNLCGNLPLALEVMGSFLCGRTSLSEWEETLNTMTKNPEKDILKTLQIIYKGLDTDLSSIFLDIACFFDRVDEKKLKMRLADCGHERTEVGVNILVERSLLRYEEPYIDMHDLLRQLGRNIVMQESPHNANKRSRLRSLKEIDQVLRGSEGTTKIQGILLSLPEPYRAKWHPDCFSKMSGLRLLMVAGTGPMHLTQELKTLPSSLKVLEWDGYPLKSLPDVDLDELTYLILRSSKLTQLWNRKQLLENLKVINLNHSKDLTRTPDFDGIPNLVSLSLLGCENLVEVHESLGNLKKLLRVDFTGCKNLETLPTILSMNSLETFILSGCLKLEKLSEFGENMGSLSELELDDTAIAELHPSIGFLTGLSVLNLNGCKNLVSLPNTMCKLKSLRTLDISYCSKLRRLPENLNENVQLEELLVAGSSTKEVPLGLPPSLSGLSLLSNLDLSLCNLCDESIPSDLSCLSSLLILSLKGNNFVNLPAGCLSNLLKLEYLYLSNCSTLRSLPDLPPNLCNLEATGCDSLEPLLDSHQLWNCLAAHDFQNFINFDPATAMGGYFVSVTSGNEIPSSFHNGNFKFEEQYDSGMSISFDIPDEYLHSSEWSGIAVCLVLQELSSEPLWQRSIYWFFQSMEVADDFDLEWMLLEKWYDHPVVFFAFFPFNNVNINHKGESKGDPISWLRLAIFTARQAITEDGVPGISCNDRWLQTPLQEDVILVPGIPLATTKEDGKLGIKECGWRLLRKEDFKTWRNTNT